MTSFKDLFCPSSYDDESRPSRWFFLSILIFLCFLIVFALIGLMAGLWKSKPHEVRYYILSRQWPVTSCIAKQCDKDLLAKKNWFIKGFYPAIAGQNHQLKNCSQDAKEFDSELLKDTLLENLKARWPKLDLNTIEPTHPTETTATKPSETTATKPSETTATKPSETTATKPAGTTATKPSETTTATTTSEGSRKALIEASNLQYHHEESIGLNLNRADFDFQELALESTNQEMNLWKEQWELYGSCSKMNQTQYFEAAIELDSVYALQSTDGKLLEAFEPSMVNLIKISDIRKEIRKKFKGVENSMMEFVCKKIQSSENGIRVYLQEIRLCFDADDNLKPIECFNRPSYDSDSASNCFNVEQVLYPSPF